MVSGLSTEKREIKEYKPVKSWKWNALDYAYLAVVAVVAGLIFYATWFVSEVASAIGGPIFVRVISYGLWFIGAPLGASLIRKPLAGFLGETLGALVETFLPTVGASTNLVYGIVQGALSETIYAITGWKRFDTKTGALAGAAAGPGAVALDAILFNEIATMDVVLLWIIASMISGAIYGYIAAKVVNSIRGE